MKLEIKKDTILNPTFGNTAHKALYHLCLIDENQNEMVELYESSDLDWLEKLQNDLTQQLKFESFSDRLHTTDS